MGECVVTKPSSFKEEVHQSFWVDAMVEEYDSIVCNRVLDVVSRPEDKSVVRSHWIYKVNQATNGDDQLINSCKLDLAREFEMKDTGLMHYFPGMEVWQGDGDLSVSQGKYAHKILRRFRMERSKPMQTTLAGNWSKEDATLGEVEEAIIYMKLVGSLMYLVNR
eukprot:PITA_21861